MAHTPQSRLVRLAVDTDHQHDVYPSRRQKVEIDESVLDLLVEKLRPAIRQEVNAELMARDRRSGSGD